jgi:ATP-binding cassette, subfamily B, bacterial MsbA
VPDPAQVPSGPRAPTGRGDLARLLGYVRPHAWVMVVIVVFSLLFGGTLAGRAALIEPLFDEVAVPISLPKVSDILNKGQLPDMASQDSKAQLARLRENVERNFLNILLAGIGLVILMPTFRLVRDYASDWLVTRLLVDLQQRLGDKLLRLPLSRHTSESTGDLVSRLTSDTAAASRAQTALLGDLIHDSTQVLAAVIGCFWVNWQLSVLALGAGPPVALVLRSFGSRIRRASRSRQEKISDVMQRLVQILTGIKIIKAFHAEALEREELAAALERFFKRAMRVVRNRVFSRSFVEFSSQLSFITILFAGIYAIINGLWGLTIGSLMAFVALVAMIYRPARSFADVYNLVQDALPASRRVFEILDAEETLPDAADAVEMSRLTQGIRFQNVSFSYGRERVLEDVDLEIRAGEVVALVGRTGSGKTTMADLLLRFHEPTQGAILLDGVDLRRIKRRSLHELIAIVTQEPFLFEGSILDNIRYGRRDLTLKEVVDAARAANAHEFIEALPEGYETNVGEFGSQLSGGQRQRVTIARAILRDPQILIFDEATSSLDAKAERAVQEAIHNLMKGRTVLLIAHRLSTVKSADRIAILQDGRIAMVGTHDELMARGGLYRELVELNTSA